MDGTGHEVVTRLAFRCLRLLAPRLGILFSESDVATRAVNIDNEKDLEFVDVEGSPVSDARDDPHKDDIWYSAVDDTAHYEELSTPLTTYSHFIDIGKGGGKFDDYDGYSYETGSARDNQHQLAADAVGSIWEEVLITLIGGGKKVDEGLAWWFNDEYVHSPDKKWYKNCSPATERYAHCVLKGDRASLASECRMRYPWAVRAAGQANHGIPFSTFPPVDNLGLHWWNAFEATRNPASLGPVLHAIHDASIPHHAGCHSGNWHGRYEKDVSAHLAGWCAHSSFEASVVKLFKDWNVDDNAPPTSLSLADRTNRQPARNWSIDMMITWMALHAYDAYANTYGFFAEGYRFDEAVARDLTLKAAALSLLVLARAGGYQAPQVLKGPVLVGFPHFTRFGYLPRSERKRRTLTVKNTGDADLRVSAISLGGSRVFSVVAPDLPAVVEPGGSLKFEATFTAPSFARPTRARSFGRDLSLKLQRLGRSPAAVAALLDKTPSQDPRFKTYKGVVRVVSDAQNTPSLELYLEAGGLPLPQEVEDRMNELRETIRAGHVDTREGAVSLKRALSDFDSVREIWRPGSRG
jgi:hypothetical protein